MNIELERLKILKEEILRLVDRAFSEQLRTLGKKLLSCADQLQTEIEQRETEHHDNLR